MKNNIQIHNRVLCIMWIAQETSTYFDHYGVFGEILDFASKEFDSLKKLRRRDGSNFSKELDDVLTTLRLTGAIEAVGNYKYYRVTSLGAEIAAKTLKDAANTDRFVIHDIGVELKVAQRLEIGSGSC